MYYKRLKKRRKINQRKSNNQILKLFTMSTNIADIFTTCFNFVFRVSFTTIDLNMCRICHEEKGLIPIFDNFTYPNIPEEIKHFSGVTVSNYIFFAFNNFNFILPPILP